jgi:hypothetical protein
VCYYFSSFEKDAMLQTMQEGLKHYKETNAAELIKQRAAFFNKLEMDCIRTRIKAFYEACPDDLVKEKEVLRQLVKTYQRFSMVNNFQRMLLFFRYQRQFLASKKRSVMRRYLFCLKMFVIIK